MTSLLITVIIFLVGYFLFLKKMPHVAVSSARSPDYASILNREVTFYQMLDKSSKDKFEKLVDEFLH